MTEHTTECEEARAGHTIEDKDAWGKVIDVRPDAYPTMYRLTVEQQAEVLACPHQDHDIVRTFCGVVLP